MTNELPDPVLTQVYSLKAVMGPPLDPGDMPAGHRSVPLVGGVFAGTEISGNLLPGGSTSWQVARPDGTAIAEIRYTLQTDRGALLHVRSRGIGQGNPGERLFHATTRIETTTPDLDWLNNGVFITVAGRTAVTCCMRPISSGERAMR